MASRDAYNALTEHPRFKYRGCAPDPDEPHLAVGSQELEDGRRVRVPVTSWQAPDIDGGEPTDVRVARETAAIDVCVECPVMMACHTYSNTLDADGKLVEEFAVLGGERWQTRTRRLVEARSGMVPEAAPDDRFATDQKKAILKALALRWDAREIAQVALMNIRTANWQRSHLANLLGLSKDATRMQLLEAAQARGLIDAAWVRADDGSVPAVVTSMKARQETVQGPRRTAGRRPSRTKFTAIAGQLVVDVDVAQRRPRPEPSARPAASEPLPLAIPGQLDLDAELAELLDSPEATVHTLIPAKRLEAAA